MWKRYVQVELETNEEPTTNTKQKMKVRYNSNITIEELHSYLVTCQDKQAQDIDEKKKKMQRAYKSFFAKVCNNESGK